MTRRFYHRGLAHCSAAAFVACTLLATSSVAQTLHRWAALPPAEVEQLDPSSATHLENSKRFVAERQWAEAVESIRRVQETDSSRLVRVDLASPLAGFERFVAAQEYCQWRLAALSAEAPEALAHYRRLVDPLAEGWLRQGEKDNDEEPLRRVIDQAFASRFGDDALLKLGDSALARGEFASARAFWQRISLALTVSAANTEVLRAPIGSALWLPLRRFDFAAHGEQLSSVLRSTGLPPPGVYPDTDLDVGAVQARMVLASILEGSRERATVELSILRLLYPNAEGQLAGREGSYVRLLERLLDESANWPDPRSTSDWPTFGGNSSRGMAVSVGIDPAGKPLWSYPLPRLTADREVLAGDGLRSADDRKSLLAYHPIVAAGQVLLRIDARGNSYIVALDLKTGKRIWQVDYSRGIAASATDATDEKPWDVSDAHQTFSQHIGVARYTLTCMGNKLFARMGSPTTVPSSRRAARWLSKDQGFLLGLDIATEGKPLEGFPIRPPSSEWSFEGPPLVSDGTLFVVMRRVEGARSQFYLAAFELQTGAAPQEVNGDDPARGTGHLKWRSRICSSATPGSGDFDELTHLLVTMDGGRIYVNTNAGAVAALDSQSGRLLWLVKYPRAALRSVGSRGISRPFGRDLVPCVAYNDLVIVAPADGERMFALEAATGQIAWALPQDAADDVVHVLGASSGVLLASGDHVYWIDVLTGKLLKQFPPGALGGPETAAPSPRGLGRGLLVGQQVWWPTRESIFVFNAQPVTTDFGRQAQLVREISLEPHGVTGGNLVIADGVLLIASGDKLSAFGP